VQTTRIERQWRAGSASTRPDSLARAEKWARALAVSWLVISSAAGCATALEQQVILYPDVVKAAQPSGVCVLELEASDKTVRAGCSAIGDVFVGDSGLTVGECDLPEVLSIARTTLCGLGATHAQYRRISESSSTCSQIRAVGFQCPSQAGAAR
jgi:hypothetical protein